MGCAGLRISTSIFTEIAASRAGGSCIDWTERGFHIGGPLRSALLAGQCVRKWVVRLSKGRAELERHLHLSL